MSEIRLIDANALKEKLTPVKLYGGGFCLMVTEKDIDDAPTVEAISNKEGYEMYNKGYMSGYERGKPERPQGEWIKRTEKNGYYWYECNRCGCLPYYARSITTIKFCPNCGAEMREVADNV